MKDYRLMPKTDEIKLDKFLQNVINTHPGTYEFDCGYCGKHFDTYPCRADKWSYKRHNKLDYTKLILFCSYNCMIKDEKEDF